MAHAAVLEVAKEQEFTPFQLRFQEDIGIGFSAIGVVVLVIFGQGDGFPRPNHLSEMLSVVKQGGTAGMDVPVAVAVAVIGAETVEIVAQPAPADEVGGSDGVIAADDVRDAIAVERLLVSGFFKITFAVGVMVCQAQVAAAVDAIGIQGLQVVLSIVVNLVFVAVIVVSAAAFEEVG